MLIYMLLPTRVSLPIYEFKRGERGGYFKALSRIQEGGEGRLFLILEPH